MDRLVCDWHLEEEWSNSAGGSGKKQHPTYNFLPPQIKHMNPMSLNSGQVYIVHFKYS